jgi:hypothetical protein
MGDPEVKSERVEEIFAKRDMASINELAAGGPKYCIP